MDQARFIKPSLALLTVLATLTGSALLWGCGDQQTPSRGGDSPPQQTLAANPEPSVLSAEAIEKALAAAQQYLDSQDLNKAQAILVTLIDKAPKEVRAHEMYGQALTILALESQ